MSVVSVTVATTEVLQYTVKTIHTLWPIRVKNLAVHWDQDLISANQRITMAICRRLHDWTA